MTQVDAVFDEIGPIDGLLNNAGLDRHTQEPIEEIPLDEWDRRVRRQRASGTFLCSRAAVRTHARGRQHRQRRVGRRRFTGSKRFVHYVASKGAVVSLTRALANELGARGIRVNCVAPGYTPTPGSAHSASTTPRGPRSGG